MKTPELKSTLMFNAAFSALTGVACLAFGDGVAGLLGTVPPVAIHVLGGLLIVFAIEVFWVARRLPSSYGFAMAIFMADVAWIALTPVVIAVFASYLSTTGVWLLVDVAVIVGVLAWLEYPGLKKLKRFGSAGFRASA